jgi:ABC-type sugar transport system permease subunit
LKRFNRLVINSLCIRDAAAREDHEHAWTQRQPLGGILTYVGIGLGFSTFIMTGAVRAIPLEIEEAAMIDGCNVYQTFLLICPADDTSHF